MCGRMVSTTDPQKVAEQFDVDEVAPEVAEHTENYNVAPTQRVLVVSTNADGVRQLRDAKWGLVPSYAKDESTGYKMINARAETMATKNTWKRLLKRKRCIVPADGFYEWKRMEKGKQPYFIHRKDGDLLAFAGVYDYWKGPEGEELESPLRSCAVITRPSAGEVTKVHDRMPVALPAELWEEWLHAGEEEPEELVEMLKSAGYPDVELRPVSTQVNSPKHNQPELLEEVKPPGE